MSKHSLHATYFNDGRVNKFYAMDDYGNSFVVVPAKFHLLMLDSKYD